MRIRGCRKKGAEDWKQKDEQKEKTSCNFRVKNRNSHLMAKLLADHLMLTRCHMTFMIQRGAK